LITIHSSLRMFSSSTGGRVSVGFSTGDVLISIT